MMLEAHQDFASFQGEQLEEILAWIRQTLLHNVPNYTRHFEQTAKRNISRQICKDQAANAIENMDNENQTPSSQLASLERRCAVEDVLSRLPDEMKLAIELRNKECLSFTEIGARMHCSAAAARKLWARAIERMQRLLPKQDDNA
jgi:RNA polymerase sigma-70 factor (ECF subfamily)